MSVMNLITLAWFIHALVFSMLCLGGAMLYVPVFKWMELRLKTVAIPLELLLNGAPHFRCSYVTGARGW